MNFSPWLVLAIATLAAACSKQDAGVAQKTNETATGNPLTAPVDYLGAVGKAKNVAQKVVDTTSVNQAIQLFYVQEDRFPKSLNELVEKRYIPSVPPAPPGTRWTYNPQTGELKATKQP